MPLLSQKWIGAEIHNRRNTGKWNEFTITLKNI